MEQIATEATRPVPVSDRDVSFLIGLLAIMEAEILAGGAPEHLTEKLRERLDSYHLLDGPDVTKALAGMNERLRVARGEYDGVP